MKSLYEEVRNRVRIGLMASALRNAGDNRDDKALIAHCRERSDKSLYQGYGGTGALRAGVKGRRTQAEELALKSATVQITRLMADAKVTVPAGISGGSNKGQKKGTNKPGTAKTTANDNAPAVKRFGSERNLLAWVAVMDRTILDSINRSAKVAPNALKSAVMDFHAAITKLVPPAE